MDVVLVARHPWGGSPPLADWHLARALVGREDCRVVYVDPPRRLDEAPSVATEQVGPRAWVVRPRVPPGASRRALGALANLVFCRTVRASVIAALGHVPCVVTLDPRRGLLEQMRAPRLVYWRRDAFSKDYRSSDSSRSRRLDAELMSGADVVVVPAVSMLDEVSRHATRVVHIANGVDVERFQVVPDPASNRRPKVVGFVGGALDRLDVDLVEAVARRRPDLRVELVGGDFGPRLGSVQNIVTREYVDYGQIPDVLAGFDVGLVPYDMSQTFNAGSFPLKALEYLAAGRPVVSTDMPALVHLDPHVRTCRTEDDFLDALDDAIRGGPSATSCRSVARGYDWQSRAAALAELLEE